MGVHIWDQWKQEDGTIGHAYGFQLGKKNRSLNGEKVDIELYCLSNCVMTIHILLSFSVAKHNLLRMQYYRKY